MAQHLLAIDQGTTGSTALVVARDGTTLGRATVEFPQHFPQPGWVEHDAEEIWKSVEAVDPQGPRRRARRSRRHRGHRHHQPARDDARLGQEDRRADSSRDRLARTAAPQALATSSRRAGHAAEIFEQHRPRHRRVFLGHEDRLDPRPRERRARSRREGRARVRDDRLVSRSHRLTGGEMHVTDVTNASRTLLLSLARSRGTTEMLALFRVPRSMLPSDRLERGGRRRDARPRLLAATGSRSRGSPATSRPRSSGRRASRAGDAKCTYGTGAFVLMNIGEKPVRSKQSGSSRRSRGESGRSR